MKPSKVLLAVLCGSERWIAPGCSQRLVEAARCPEIEIVHCFDISPVIAARNICCSLTLQSRADWLEMVDCDTLPPEFFVGRVIDEIDSRKDVGVAVLPTWMINGLGVCLNISLQDYVPNQAYLCETNLEPGWKEIKVGGAACMFIRRSVLEKLGPNPFRFPQVVTDKIQRGEPTLLYNEDFTFCEQARKAGFKVFTNSTYVCDHIHSHSLAAIEMNRQLTVQAMKTGKPLAVGFAPNQSRLGSVPLIVPLGIQTDGAQ